MTFTPCLSRVSAGMRPVSSEIVRLAAARLMARGKQVVNLIYGQNTLPIPKAAKAAGRRVYKERTCPYADSQGLPELRAAAAHNFEKMGISGAKPEDIVVGCGSLELLELATFSILNPGDQALLISPYYFLYPYHVRKTGAEAIAVQTDFDSGYKLTPAKLRDAIDRHPKLKLVIINTPNNPAATMYTRLELTALAEVFANTDLWVFSDEVYHEITYGLEHVSLASINEDMRARTVTFDSASKTLALGGERVGWMTGNPQIVEEMPKNKTHSTFSSSLSGQRAAAAALSDHEIGRYFDWMRIQFEARRTLLLSIVRADFPQSVKYHEPEGTFYFSFELPEGLSVPGLYPDNYSISLRFALHLLKNKFVAVTPGEAMGFNNLIRLSFAVDFSAIHEIARIGEALRELG